MMNISITAKTFKVIVECKILDRTHLIDIFAQEQRRRMLEPRVGTMPIHLKLSMWTHLEPSKRNGMRGPETD
jgi:hypothetical protein